MKNKSYEQFAGDSPQLDMKRRDFLKLGALGGVGAAATLAAPGVALANTGKTETEESNAHLFTEHDEFPVKVSPDFKPFHAKNMSLSQMVLKGATSMPLLTPAEGDENRPGFTAIDNALDEATWDLQHRTEGHHGFFNTGFYNWDNKVKPKRHKFKSKAEASNAIKRAARLFGADLVGITHWDPRWDYETHYNAITRQEVPWSEYPFKPKTVIVMALEMDYEGMAAAPSSITDAAVGERYAHMAYTAYGVSAFIRQLGYNAIASGNDTGLSVPYAIAAGIGEGSRMGMVVTYNYGPRVRLMKVYTELDFVEYDKPKTFGVRHFCERCKRCADACPSKAISQKTYPSLYPTEEEKAPTQFVGVEKWWFDGMKCLQYWIDSQSSCGTCITSCPYNKPDFWHHRTIEKLNSLMPGPLHSFMREMDIWFGFGDSFDEAAVGRFWDPEGRKYDGRS